VSCVQSDDGTPVWSTSGTQKNGAVREAVRKRCRAGSRTDGATVSHVASDTAAMGQGGDLDI
jgi:hypothetical protein